MPIAIVRQDITRIKADAIVNAANTALKMGGGVCGAIFSAAGEEELRAACDQLAPIRTGEAAITPGYKLPAKYVIHAAGPVYDRERKAECERDLRAAYLSSLELAAEHGCESIAFPLISSGIFGYPKDEALRTATSAIRDFLEDHDMDVTLAVFDKAAFAESQKLMGEVASYIDEYYADTRLRKRRRPEDDDIRSFYQEESILLDMSVFAPRAPVPASLDRLVGSLDEPFSETLLRLIDARGKTDVEVYKRANIDRKLFSKIRSNKGYMPSKRTAIAFAIALELTLNETENLLERAGFALSHAVKFDVIVEYFIKNGKYDIYRINEVLFQYDQPLLGG